MNHPIALDKCLNFIRCQLKPGGRAAVAGSAVTGRAVTISRQAGCGALIIAEKLAARLQAETPSEAPPWTVFDRNLMEKVLEDHQLPKRLAQALPEDRITEWDDLANEIFSVRPPAWTLIEQTSETILKLAALGNVILIGRAGNIITASQPQVLHVRLIAPLEQRISRACRVYGLKEAQARTFCRDEDEGRRRYVKKYFLRDVADPLLYHLVINTGLVSLEAAADLIAFALRTLPLASKCPVTGARLTQFPAITAWGAPPALA